MGGGPLSAEAERVAAPAPAPQPAPASGSVSRDDYGKFVRFLHLASPYVVGHRGTVFVITLPGEVVARKDRLVPLLEDILLLHGLGVRLVIVAGVKELIDAELHRRGREPVWEGAYRVTDAETMRIAIEVAGSLSTEISAHLSKARSLRCIPLASIFNALLGIHYSIESFVLLAITALFFRCVVQAPSIPMVRRHARGEGQFHFAPAVQVVSGNYVTAKRRGIVNGIDFGLMGQVRFVQEGAIQQQLDAGNIVLLTNVGVSGSGELLNCNSYDVATHAAVELQADKLLCLTGADVRALNLPHYLPLDDAERLIQATLCGDSEECAMDDASPETSAASSGPGWMASWWGGNGSRSDRPSFTDANQVEMLLDLDSWQQIGFPNAVVSAVVACRQGVKRAHLIDIEQDGALLLEMYTRDGINGVCMIAADLYEGIRRAEPEDAAGTAYLLSMLATGGHDLPFPPEAASDHLGKVTVMEREGKLLACAVECDLGTSPDGLRVAEISAFIVDPPFRRQGMGDSLLDFVEQGMRRQGFQRIVVVAEQGSYEWFVQRSFEPAGDASTSELIPAERRSSVPEVAQLLVKPILELDASMDAPAGKRIGF